jgi:hypothetical protein
MASDQPRGAGAEYRGMIPNLPLEFEPSEPAAIEIHGTYWAKHIIFRPSLAATSELNHQAGVRIAAALDQHLP